MCAGYAHETNSRPLAVQSPNLLDWLETSQKYIFIRIKAAFQNYSLLINFCVLLHLKGKSKSHNFILFNVNESVTDVKATYLIKRLKIETVISSAIRIGKQVDKKTRLVEVSLNSSDAVISIKNSKKVY